MIEFDADTAKFDTADTEVVNDMNRNTVTEFRKNQGKVGGLFEGVSLLLLHTTGAKSGQPRLTPLVYLIVDDKMYIVGSFAGAPKNPAWVHNLRAHSRVRIEVGAQTLDAVARELHGHERDTTFAEIVNVFPLAAEYQAKTTRVTPLFELIRL
jgi:deazaflavin-dependent oxidoreductase (nitroreductase family)